MVKSTFGTVEPVHDLSYLVGDRMAIFYGSFLAAYEGLCAGAHGWISGILNVVTSAAKAMRHAIVVENDARKGLSDLEADSADCPFVDLSTDRPGQRPGDLSIDAEFLGTSRAVIAATLSSRSTKSRKASCASFWKSRAGAIRSTCWTAYSAVRRSRNKNAGASGAGPGLNAVRPCIASARHARQT